jgi:uncharacterized protein YfaS (alpha-2-macroglobulin family)
MRTNIFALLILFVLISISPIDFCLSKEKTNSKSPVFFQDYDKDWKTVDSLVNYGLPKSAMEIVEKIYSKAKTENNSPNFIKAIIYKAKLKLNTVENSYEQNIEYVTEEMHASSFPVKPVLQSMLAEMYWAYYQQNRYSILDRSKTVGFSQDDIKTWDLSKFVDITISYYKESLSDAVNLQSVQVDIYDEILNDYRNNKNPPDGRVFRPTLYDFLVHRAIDFFMNKESDLTKPADEFNLNDPALLSPAEEFVNLEIKTTDAKSFKFYAATLLQNAVRFHLKDAKPDALVEIDLKRLNYISSYSGNEDRFKYYLTALEEMEKKFSSNPVSSKISYYKASYIYNRSLKYDPLKSEEFKWDAKTAYEICENAVNKYPQSEGAFNCKSLMTNIKSKNLKIEIESMNIPGKAFKCLVTYKNVDKLYFRVIKTSQSDIKDILSQIDYNYGYASDKVNEALINYYAKMTATEKFTIALPDDFDFQTHKTEIKIPSLECGEYVILAGTDENLQYDKNAVAYSFTTVTNLSYFSRTLKSGSMEFYVMNRLSGEPIKDAEVTMHIQKYNPDNYRYEYEKSKTFKTDKDGYILIKAPKDYLTFYLELENGKDYLNTSLNGRDFLSTYYINGLFNQYRSGEEDESIVPYKHIYFFTDRAIYRPGQTVYFKGIVLETKGNETNIVPGFNVKTQFKDVNYKNISSLDLQSNEFGTFNGSFVAPTGVLNGQMTILVENLGSIPVQIEEYKRPKFEVNFDPVKGSYRLNDIVELKGIAKSFSGANVDNAKVKYRVVRKANFPYWWFYWYGYYPSSPEVEVLSGTTNTNENGEFNIKFTALPDKSVPKESKPYFTYKVTADITDLNGETRSGNKVVSVGYNSLIIGLDIPASVDKNDKSDFKIITTNLNGEFEPAEGIISIYKLKNPAKNLKSTFWKKPDKYIYSKDEYEKLFPDFEYNDENNFIKWEKEFKVNDYPYNTALDSTLHITNLNQWNQGMYLAEITSKDKYGEDVKEQFYFSAYSTGEKTLPYPTFDWFNAVKSKGEPGDYASFVAGSSSKIKLLYELELDGSIIEKQWITLDNEQRYFTIPIKEEYRGNVYVHYTYIVNNRGYSHIEMIEVPYTNKMLDISFESFRDKLKAGEDEEWRLKIKGKYGDKVAAEMVATLYDASLEAFKPNNWSLYFLYPRSSRLYWTMGGNFESTAGYLYSKYWSDYTYPVYHDYDKLNWFGYPSESNYYYGMMDYMQAPVSLNGVTTIESERKNVDVEQTGRILADEKTKDEGVMKKDKSITEISKEEFDGEKVTQTMYKGDDLRGGRLQQNEITGVTARKNFSETAFFYPELRTDENGEIIVKFKIPEALTKWKMLGFAHTKDLKIGFTQNQLVTQKELMVVPNAPRFLRESDKITISAKITNLSEKDLSGNAQLELYDAFTMKPIDEWLGNKQRTVSFETQKGLSTSVSWTLDIPFGVDAVTYKIVAKADNFSDGEENVLPVLTNRMLVTETLPLPVRSNQTKNFTLDKLANNKSTTLTNYKLTLEFTSNPAWYAVQALPYLMEYPWECAEQVFSRFYSNSIATHIANSNPKVKQVFDTWAKYEPDALMSNLDKNEELKSVLLEETPWVNESKNEGERKRRIGVLFELNRMTKELDKAVDKLGKMQYSNGGWPWFAGMPEDRYITQYIIEGFGHLDHLGIKNVRNDNTTWNMVYKGIGYMDYMMKKDYEYLLAEANAGRLKLSDNNLWQIDISYLYARSYFRDIPVEDENKEAFNYFKGQAEKYWVDNSRHLQGMIGLSLHRYENKTVPQLIVKSMNENAIKNDELGMYWKDNEGGWYWYQAPIETQALLIEFYDEVAKDKQAVDDLKVWLLKQKQTQNWQTTKATAEACYALLLKGTDWLASDVLVDITVGNQKIDPKNMPDVKVEAGTGYFKTNWYYDEIKPEMGNVTVSKKDEGVSWGALYWQYFEQLDKITKAETPLKLDKKLFLQENTSTGLVITPITENTQLKVGDIVKVRIELRSDRDMEYVHMKDMRAACFEPINVISQYKYQGGLGYYETTRDASTNFFFGWIPKGTYVFEYALRVNNSGDFSNGITSIQCMYAPEFTAHSEGVRVNVK